MTSYHSPSSWTSPISCVSLTNNQPRRVSDVEASVHVCDPLDYRGLISLIAGRERRVEGARYE
jgi:hypothetical protein